MSKGVKIGIVIVGVIIVAVAAWLLIVRWGLGNDAASSNTNTTTNTNTTNTNAAADANSNGGAGNTNTTTEPAERPVVDDSAAVLRLARVVVERYGSFSNQNNFENITSLEPFMTQRFQTESAAYISANQADSKPEEYYGISTEVLSLEATSLEETTATISVVTQRIESKGNEDPKKFNQTAQVQLEEVGGNWKVDSITWK